MLEQLLIAGVDVFRINMAHGDRASHTQAVTNIRAASTKTNFPAGILVDLAGPKIRLGQLTQNPLKLENGQTVQFVRGLESSNDAELTCNYEPLINEVAVGETICLADGLARLTVTDKSADSLTCIVSDGGQVRTRQGVNLPSTKLSIPALGDIDIDNAKWAAQQGVEFVSISFVRNADEVRQLKQILADHNSTALVVSKIEKGEALEQLDDIVRETGAVMVARGDLGVEIAIEKTPAAQKKIIQTCLKHRKPVIVATQMLESMHSSKQPTRAEVTDVANAILDGADACMLSGETAIGEYPLEAVTMMNKIMRETEKTFARQQSKMAAYSEIHGWDTHDAIIFGAAQIAKRVNAKMVVIASQDLQTALLKSKQRDFIPTVCLTDKPETYRHMALFWGVVPVLCPQAVQEPGFNEFVHTWVKNNTHLQPNDPFVFVSDDEHAPGLNVIRVSHVT